jgi:hypothetical protein
MWRNSIQILFHIIWKYAAANFGIFLSVLETILDDCKEANVKIASESTMCLFAPYKGQSTETEK